MNLSITAIFYGLLGAGVAISLLANDTAGPAHERWFRVLTAFLFWPIYVPLLLRFANPPTSPDRAADQSAPPDYEMTQQIE